MRDNKIKQSLRVCDEHMKPIIYVDILVCVNLFINYFILLSTMRLTNIHTKRWRLFAGALLGALYSLYIFLPDVSSIVSALIKFCMSCTIIIVAFKLVSLKSFFKLVGCFYFISFAFCGVMFLIWLFISPKNLFLKNGIVYFNISPLIFIVSTLISYFVIRISSRLAGRENPQNLYCDILIENNNVSQKLKAKIDTGNNLKEPFSGLPVVVTEEKFIKNLLGKKTTFRVIPFNTVSSSGLMRAFKPDSVTIYYNKKKYPKEAYIAISPESMASPDFSAISPFLF